MPMLITRHPGTSLLLFVTFPLFCAPKPSPFASPMHLPGPRMAASSEVSLENGGLCLFLLGFLSATSSTSTPVCLVYSFKPLPRRRPFCFPRTPSSASTLLCGVVRERQPIDIPSGRWATSTTSHMMPMRVVSPPALEFPYVFALNYIMSLTILLLIASPIRVDVSGRSGVRSTYTCASDSFKSSCPPSSSPLSRLP